MGKISIPSNFQNLGQMSKLYFYIRTTYLYCTRIICNLVVGPQNTFLLQCPPKHTFLLQNPQKRLFGVEHQTIFIFLLSKLVKCLVGNFKKNWAYFITTNLYRKFESPDNWAFSINSCLCSCYRGYLKWGKSEKKKLILHSQVPNQFFHYASKLKKELAYF